jgi:hypothetical protein
VRNYDLALNKIEELQKVIQQSENRLQLIFANPHLIALARGDLYLKKEAVAAFREPLGVFLFNLIPAWVRGIGREEPAVNSPPPDAAVAESQEAAYIPPQPTPPAEVGPPPQDPGLRTTVVAVVTALAELGLIQVPGAGAVGKPALPADLHPGAAPTVVGGEIAGAWSPPPRPTIEGPRSAVRRAMYEMLSRG